MRPLEPRATQAAALATSAREHLTFTLAGVVAAGRVGVVDPERDAAGDDLMLVEIDQRRMNADAFTRRRLDAELGRQVGGALERVDERGSTVGIARVVDRVDAEP